MMNNPKYLTTTSGCTLMITYPITLDSLEQEAPLAHKALLLMPKEPREIALLWFNKLSTSPMTYHVADAEKVKEDAYASILRNKYGIRSLSTKVGRLSKHHMSDAMIADFLSDPEEMMRAVRAEVEVKREHGDKIKLKKMFDKYGSDWLARELRGLGYVLPEKAANDDKF